MTSTSPYIERACLFGENRSLIGILSLPAGAHCADLAVVVLNTGATHRVGHHRMYVALARALAARGHTALRFDFARIGDSRPADSGATLLDSNLADIRAALDWMETHLASRRFVLIGLCSGADYAVMYSHTDPRIAGLVLLDPYIPKTPRYLVQYTLQRLSNPRSIFQFRPSRSLIFRTILEFVLGPRREAAGLQHISFRGQDAHATLETIYSKNVAAGLKILVFCTGMNSTPRHTYERQFIDSFKNVDFGDKLRVHFLRDCDHLFSLPSCRDALNALTLAWIDGARIADAAAPTEGLRDEPAATGACRSRAD